MAPAALPQDFGGHLRNFLARVGYSVPQVPMGFGEAGGGNRAISDRDRIEFRTSEQPTIEALSSRYGRRGQLGREDQQALRLMLHELMHQPLMSREPDWYGNQAPDSRLWEEAAAEQASRDVLPAVLRQMFGSHFDESAYRAPDDYGRRVKAYQQLSVIGSGARKHQDRAARVWRRRYVNESTAGRQRMMDEANAARASWTRPTRQASARAPGY